MNEIDPKRYKQWQQIMERKIDERIATSDQQNRDKRQQAVEQTAEEKTEEKEQNDEKTKEKTKEMKELKKQYAVLAADKAASTYVIHCKVHLAKQVMEEINTNETYKHIVASTVEEIQDSHAKWMLQKNMLHWSLIGRNKTMEHEAKTRYYWSARMARANG